MAWILLRCSAYWDVPRCVPPNASDYATPDALKVTVIHHISMPNTRLKHPDPDCISTASIRFFRHCPLLPFRTVPCQCLCVMYFNSRTKEAYIARMRYTRQVGGGGGGGRKDGHLDGLVDEVEALLVGCDVGRKATLISHVAGILAVLLLDDALQGVVHLCTSLRRRQPPHHQALQFLSGNLKERGEVTFTPLDVPQIR